MEFNLSGTLHFTLELFIVIGFFLDGEVVISSDAQEEQQNERKGEFPGGSSVFFGELDLSEVLLAIFWQMSKIFPHNLNGYYIRLKAEDLLGKWVGWVNF